MLTRAPFVSVLMSCHNASRWLAESVESILNQTFSDFEFVVIDDGSTDGTSDLLDDFQARDRRILMIKKQHTGLADSLNVGMDSARGQWIARLDADDIAEPTRLAQQISRARSGENIVFIGSGLSIINEGGDILGQYSYPSRHVALLHHLRTAQKFPPHSSAIYRKDIATRLGGYRLRMKRAQDLDLWLRLSEEGELACIPEPLVRIRKHAEQISHEEDGRRQLLDCRMGLTSYWIRSYGGADPLDGDEKEYHFFKKWLLLQLTHAGFFEVQAYKKRLKDMLRFLSFSDFSCGIFFILARPRFFLILLKEQIFGELLTRRIACRWMK